MSARGPVFTLAQTMVLAAWLGAVLVVAAVVAPSAFAVLPTRTLAGALVGRVLPVLFWSGAILGVALADWKASRAAAISGICMLASCALAQFVITPRIAAIRSAAGVAMDQLDAADPRRVQFGQLHGLSVLCLGIAGLAAVVALVVVSRRLLAHRTSLDVSFSSH